ncbi:MAG TPA: hypothetical protein VHJ82_05160 [Actinomycetota bacterium]|nr:hypothetical protein [Actinomycetota bacterium]
MDVRPYHEVINRGLWCLLKRDLRGWVSIQPLQGSPAQQSRKTNHAEALL